MNGVAQHDAGAGLPSTNEVVADRFEVRGELGEGGMGHVYRVFDRKLGRDVALKLIVPRYLGRPEREERFLRELELGRRAERHPHLVEPLDGGRLPDNGWPFLVMALASGRPLSHRLALGPMAPRLAADIARQIAGAVAVLHRAGVVHRDITPMNVLLDGCEAVLIDLSHAGDAAAPRLAAGHAGRLTQEHEFPGTHQYMSPEQARAEPAMQAMDIYAFGVTLGHMLVGLTLDQSSREASLRLQREGKVKPPRVDVRVYTDIPPRLAELVHVCTAVDHDQRPTIEQVIEWLDEVLAAMPTRAGGRLVGPDETVMIPRQDLPSFVTDAPQPQAPSDPPTGGQPPTSPGSTVDPQPSVPPVGLGAALDQPIAGGDSDVPPQQSSGAPRLSWWRVVLTALIVMVVVVGAAAWWWSSTETTADDGQDEQPLASTPGHVVPPTMESHPPDPPVNRGELQEGGARQEHDDRGEVEVAGDSGDEAPAPEPLVSDAVTPPPAKPSKRPRPQGKKKAAPIKAAPIAEQPTPPKPELRPSETAECEAHRSETKAAVAAAAWKNVAALTKRRECWSNHGSRKRLRVRALFETRAWSQCVEQGRGINEPQVKQWVDLCQRHVD